MKAEKTFNMVWEEGHITNVLRQIFCFTVIEIKPRALHVLGKYSVTRPYPQLYFFLFILK